MRIDSAFDGGNINVVRVAKGNVAELEIAPDAETDYKQWFCFDIHDAKNRDCTLRITNAGKAAFARQWRRH